MNDEVAACAALEVVATGFDFPTSQTFDEQGAAYVVDYDDFYEIEPGAWYGWPDFASGIRLDDPRWEGRGREPVLAEHPDPKPPQPFVTFDPHAGSNGVDFCRDAAFGFEGDAFVALFGRGVLVAAAAGLAATLLRRRRASDE